MIEPSGALFAAILVIAAGALLFWPRRGFFWNWQRLRRMDERILTEDMLKHLYDYEYRRQTPTLESLSGALGVSGNRAAEVLVRVEARRLVESAGGNLHLTPSGRTHAVHVVRAHRLWEHYLAEKTGTSAAEWHGQAEFREHDLSRDQADHLAEQMGHPAFDPHGDPIPTTSGEIAPRQDQPFTALATGILATIVHMEDEPEDVYAQVVAEGLYLGMPVEVVDVTPNHIRFVADGKEHVLAPVIAANVFVAPLPDEQVMAGPYDTLVILRPRQKGKVIRISPACRGLERRRLLDLGIVPGTVIEAEMKSPTGDPTAYRVRNALIALRREQGEHIHIEKQMETV